MSTSSVIEDYTEPQHKTSENALDQVLLPIRNSIGKYMINVCTTIVVQYITGSFVFTVNKDKAVKKYCDSSRAITNIISGGCTSWLLPPNFPDVTNNISVAIPLDWLVKVVECNNKKLFNAWWKSPHLNIYYPEGHQWIIDNYRYQDNSSCGWKSQAVKSGNLKLILYVYLTVKTDGSIRIINHGCKTHNINIIRLLCWLGYQKKFVNPELTQSDRIWLKRHRSEFAKLPSSCKGRIDPTEWTDSSSDCSLDASD